VGIITETLGISNNPGIMEKWSTGVMEQQQTNNNE
jgi:hypothetical protein